LLTEGVLVVLSRVLTPGPRLLRAPFRRGTVAGTPEPTAAGVPL
jgi:hypothetical protein